MGEREREREKGERCMDRNDDGDLDGEEMGERELDVDRGRTMTMT